MPSGADVIKEFLVSLGWKVDSQGQKRFTDGVKSADVGLKKLATSIAIQTEAVHQIVEGLKHAAGAVIDFSRAVAEGMEKLYFASQRTKASVANIQAFGFAAGQMGSTADAAAASLENLARFMRVSPGGESRIRALHVETRQANGELRDTTEILQDLGKSLANMPTYRRYALSQMLGIDEKTMIALTEGVGQFSHEYLAMLKAVGMDSTKAAKGSHEFMNQIRSVGAAITILWQKIGAGMAGRLSATVKRFREWFVSHFEQIGKAIDYALDLVFKFINLMETFASDVVQDVQSVIDWFNRMDVSTKKLIAAFAAVGVAFAALGALFLASPVTATIALIAALAAALFLLWDDYEGFKRGADHALPWEKWEPQIEAAKKQVQELAESFERLLTAFNNLGNALSKKIEVKFDISNLIDLVNLVTAVVSGDWAEAGKIAKGMKQKVEVLPENRSGIDQALHGEGRPSDKQMANTHMSGLFGEAWANTKKFFDVPGQMKDYSNLVQTRNVRTNNPGMLVDNKYVRAMPGALGLEELPAGSKEKAQFERFDTAEHGLLAMARNLVNYSQRGISTVSAIVETWTKGDSPEKQANYKRDLDKFLDVKSNQTLDLQNPELLAKVMRGIATHEGGAPYRPEQFLTAAQGALSGQGITVNQTLNTTVNGVSDPKEAAAEVGRAQSRGNGLLIRHLSTQLVR